MRFSRAFVLAGLFCLPLSAQAATSKRMELVMGTLLEIETGANTPYDADKSLEAAFKEVRRLDNLLSNYKESSEISRINRAAYPESALTSQEMIRFLTRAKELSEETSGCFDIMVEPLTKLWHLRERTLVRAPEEKIVAHARLKSSSKNLEIYTSDNTVRFLREGSGIDTGGIGKGYALDKALAKAREAGAKSANLNFGGEILFWNSDPAKERVYIKNPLEPERVWKVLSMENYSSTQTAVSTSANYERYVVLEENGKSRRLGHILNPKTGEPVNSEVRSVTVASQDATRADALSTGVFVMGLEEGKRFAADHPQDWILILYEDGSGTLRSFASGDWARQVKTGS